MNILVSSLPNQKVPLLPYMMLFSCQSHLDQIIISNRTDGQISCLLRLCTASFNKEPISKLFSVRVTQVMHVSLGSIVSDCINGVLGLCGGPGSREGR